MSTQKVAIPTVLVILLSSCAHYFPPLHEERIEQYKNTCKSIGFKTQTIEYSNCVLGLEKSYLSGTNTTNNGAGVQQMIDQDRMQRQMLNHGAGGCAPNFSTGGCL